MTTIANCAQQRYTIMINEEQRALIQAGLKTLTAAIYKRDEELIMLLEMVKDMPEQQLKMQIGEIHGLCL